MQSALHVVRLMAASQCFQIGLRIFQLHFVVSSQWDGYPAFTMNVAASAPAFKFRAAMKRKGFDEALELVEMMGFAKCNSDHPHYSHHTLLTARDLSGDFYLWV